MILALLESMLHGFFIWINRLFSMVVLMIFVNPMIWQVILVNIHSILYAIDMIEGHAWLCAMQKKGERLGVRGKRQDYGKGIEKFMYVYSPPITESLFA